MIIDSYHSNKNHSVPNDLSKIVYVSLRYIVSTSLYVGKYNFFEHVDAIGRFSSERGSPLALQANSTSIVFEPKKLQTGDENCVLRA